MSAPKPETPGQARRWDRIKKLAVDAGVCHACAAQLAYGSQLGFAQVKPPCAGCSGVVAGWPSPKLNGWRVPGGDLALPQTWEAVGMMSDRRTPSGRELRRSSTVDEMMRNRDG